MEPEATIRLTVNGEAVQARTPVRQSLVDFLREELDLTGSHVGCEHGVCGACTLLLNGEIVRGCLTLAVQAEGADVTTVEGADLKSLQEAFVERNALQCGFCTPGMLLTADALLKRNPTPTRKEARAFLSGNYCRCTGYHAIVDAVLAVAGRETS